MKDMIKQFINTNVLTDEEVVLDGEDNIFELGIVNSLFSMKLITFLEDTFHISVEYEDMNLDNFSSINNILEYLKRKGVNDVP